MKKIKMLFLWVILGFLSFTGCQQEPCFEYPFPYCESCEDLYQPVCGCNGKTYQNACEAECMGISKHYYGKCPDISTR